MSYSDLHSFEKTIDSSNEVTFNPKWLDDWTDPDEDRLFEPVFLLKQTSSCGDER